jgi:hypothetical protein
MLSLRKLSLFSLSMLTLCFVGIINDAQAAVSAIENAVLRAKRPSRGLSLRDTQALVLSNNEINTFVLRFSAAVRAGAQPNPDPVLQRQLVCELRQTLAKEFSITLIFTPTIQLTATDFNSLLALIQQLSANITYDSSLTANLSLESITRNDRGLRTLQIQGLEYVVQTPVSGPSTLIPALDQYTVVETRHGIFKIQTLVATVISAPIPFGT